VTVIIRIFNIQLPYDEINSIVKEMSALTAAFRLLPVVLSKNDWEGIQQLLHWK
jgi:hypothetical protein